MNQPVPSALEERLQIQDVMLRYAAAVDERDLTAYAALFAPDVEVTGFADEPVHGREAWVDYVRRALTRFGATQHLLAVPLVTLEGERAHCRTDFQAMHELAGSDGKLFMLWATYQTDLHRSSDGWQITRHHLVQRAARTG